MNIYILKFIRILVYGMIYLNRRMLPDITTSSNFVSADSMKDHADRMYLTHKDSFPILIATKKDFY